MILIRKIQIGDAENLLNLLKKLDTETTFLLYEKGERKRTIEQQRKDIQEQLAKGVLTFVLEDNKKLVGYVFGNIYTANRKKHCMNLAIAILQEYTGKGYGTKLMNTIEEYAINHGITRLELEVSVNNPLAINLYEKLGFKIEGERQNAYLIDGEFDNDFIMAKIISNK